MRPVLTALACFLAAPLFANDGNPVLTADLCDHAMQQIPHHAAGQQAISFESHHR